MDRLLKVGDVFSFLPTKVVGTLETFGVVYKTTFDGGGTGHGPHDIFPNGHRVHYIDLEKVEVGDIIAGKTTIVTIDEREGGIDPRRSFYQTGCFNGLVDKSEVHLIKTIKVNERKEYILS